jgi:hypothetical protein
MGWRQKCKKCNAFHRDADAEAKRQPPPATTSGAEGVADFDQSEGRIHNAEDFQRLFPLHENHRQEW